VIKTLRHAGGASAVSDRWRLVQGRSPRQSEKTRGGGESAEAQLGLGIAVKY